MKQKDLKEIRYKIIMNILLWLFTALCIIALTTFLMKVPMPSDCCDSDSCQILILLGEIGVAVFLSALIIIFGYVGYSQWENKYAEE